MNTEFLYTNKAIKIQYQSTLDICSDLKILNRLWILNKKKNFKVLLFERVFTSLLLRKSRMSTTSVDQDKEQKHFHYEHRIKKLNHRHYDSFDGKNFQKARQYSTHKKLLKSLGRVGMCVNDKTPNCISVDDLDKVCFILCNSYEDKKNSDLGVGPLNDSVMIGINFHRRGYHVFYLYNTYRDEFLKYAKFFIEHTKTSLVLFYSGRGEVINNNQSTILFKDGAIAPNDMMTIIANSNGTTKVVMITDSSCGGCAFDVNVGIKNIISLGISKPSGSEKEEGRTHGIFTYYFCKVLNECPDITPSFLTDRMNPPLKRFSAEIICNESNPEIDEQPLF